MIAQFYQKQGGGNHCSDSGLSQDWPGLQRKVLDGLSCLQLWVVRAQAEGWGMDV